MKRKLYLVGLAISMTLVLLAGQAIAQNSEIFMCTVPFAFHAGPVKMPAGQYIVKIPSSQKGLICLESVKSAHTAMLLTSPFVQGKSPASAKLVFNRYGATYFLTKVWSSVSASGQELMKSKAEKEFVQQARIPETVDVALSHR
ncbi:MAG: hypothetical protein H6Q07_485 [Acidobacteria bacterium]|nr:hypothetical protein [Acidobacteriota bacterium]